MMLMFRLQIRLAAVLWIAVLLGGCDAPVIPMITPQRAVVDVLHPRQGEIDKSIEIPGDVVGFYEAALHAKVTGYLKSISVDKGDSVKTGQVLAEIEVPELQSNLVRSQASLEIERITYDRLRKVQQSDPRLIAQQDVDMAYAKYREAQAAVATLQTMVGYTRIIAPFDGVITGRFADPGALIRAGGGDIGVDETSGLISPGATEGAGGHREGGGPILTLADIDKLRVYIYVPEASYPFIHVGTPASLHFDEFPDRVFNGTVARYASSLDLATRTMLTEVDIDNPKRLVYPRSYAHVTIELVRHPDALSVPASAIQGSGDSARLLVVKDGRLVEAPVKTGINTGAYVEVTSGLSPRSLVVTTYSNNLTPGQQVDCRIQNVDGQATSASAQGSD
ncbi:MAG: efflux RND transporter periplasmic adaptor subunit [Candidatus Binatus sp.]|jgi:membrane fusion protein (multidrug efflux system)|uniref:efflux RND transporter periplasmic adaptor subunit n=1 Tax=Candidatus Binatus sp. TaxID=2811406 RepID=UPI003C716A71